MSTATLEAPENIDTADLYRSDAPVLEIPLSVAIQSAAAMLTSAAKSDVTPILNVAHFDGSELFATDRYKVARFPMPAKPVSKDDRLTLGAEFFIPRAALEWVSKITPKTLRFKLPLASVTDAGYTIRYESDADALTVTASVVDMSGKTERSQAFDNVTGNFPPVKRLFPGEDSTPGVEGPQAFNPAYMGQVLAFIGKYSVTNAPFKITLYAGPTGKGGPAVIEGAGASFLLMPNLILR